jgi:hypothetical protein
MAKKHVKALKPDTVFKEYWKQKNEFADFFNAYLFGGKEVLRAEDLEEKDSESSTVLEMDETDLSVQAARDLLKVSMSQDGVEYAILGIENQDYIHYAMPFQVESYDAYTYDRQYKQKKAFYKETNQLRGDEKMSGIQRTDRFTPVITVVIYYGSKPWDGPLCLYDMLDLPEELKPFVNNFKINLVEARDNNLIFHNQNNQDLFTLFKIICDNKMNRKEKKARIEDYEAEREIDKSVRLAINATGNIKMQNKEKEDVAMIQLWEELREEGREEGQAQMLIEMSQENGLDDTTILSKLQEKVGLSLEMSLAYLNKYGKSLV